MSENNHSLKEVGVSVIICCYNSATRISTTLEHLFRQEVPSVIGWEIILVNNNSSDDTIEVARATWSKFGDELEFRIVDEPQPGLIYAKEKGIQSARYEYLLFCDDDNWLAEHYVSKAFSILQQHPNVGVVGGRSEAVSEIDLPYWFPTFQMNYAVGVQALDSGDVTGRGYVWGAGMVFRKSVYMRLKEAGFRSLLSGRKGDVLTAGEDSELCRWFILAGYRIYYSEDLHFQHVIPPARLTKEYYRKLEAGILAGQQTIRKYRYVIQAKKAGGLSRWKEGIFALVALAYTWLRRLPIDAALEKMTAWLPIRLPFYDRDTRAIMNAAQRFQDLSS